MQTFKQPLSKESELYYLKRSREGDLEARNILVEYNLRLVAHIVKKYNNFERDTDDLISIGTIGLIKAINTYDIDKGSRLVTYASRCIENELLMMLRQERKCSREFSLYEPIGTDKEGNEINLLDIVEHEDTDIAEHVILEDNIRQLYDILERQLDSREIQVLTLRYGLFGKQPLTQREVAKQMSISRSYVSRIEKKALLKLRREFDGPAA
ncbi:MAG: RNA polymerase sporulation sigma factor SigK [Lachnospiraceae bacterium]|nr:RNA polymerase sporulation sigma factor SigK [Lachnospiraceae bacterium]MDE6626588.1 RNA polymerase sporulation sigma factor SigK [Lachnospiraceae bacterium]